MKRLMIGVVAASLLSAASLAAQADERGGRQGYSRAPSHAPAYDRTHRAVPRHYQPPRRHYAPPARHYGHYRHFRHYGHGYRAHSGWGRHYGAPRYWRHDHRPYRNWR